MPSWIVFAFFIGSWLIITIFGGIIDQTTLGADSASALQTLASWDVFALDTFLGVIPYPTFNDEWFAALGSVLIWDSALFEGTWGQYVRWGFLALSAGLIISITAWIIGMIRGSN